MSDQPWMKFYPRDWRGDQALRAVSLAARGLWMECLCIMHEAKPYGHLMLNGQKVEDGTLARMAGISVDEVSALMAELRQAGVFSLTSKGVVFSRRMTKDFSRSKIGQKSAEKRWSQAIDNADKKQLPNGSPNRKAITQKPEARSQNKDSPPDGFAEFYAAYPNHVARGAAEKAYRAASKKIDHQTLMEAVRRFAEQCKGKEKRFIAHPATWLNAERWADESEAQPIAEQPVKSPQAFTVQDWELRIRNALRGGVWPDEYGPAPCGSDAHTLALAYYNRHQRAA